MTDEDKATPEEDAAAPTEETEAATDTTTDAEPSSNRKAEVEAKAKAFAKDAGAVFKKGAAKTGKGAKAIWADPLMFVKTMDRFLDWMRATFPPEWFEWASRGFSKMGHVGLFAAAFVGAFYYIMVAFTEKAVSPILYGFGFVLLLVIIQYSAHHFLNAGKKLIGASPSSLTSSAFIQCVALMAAILGALSFIAFTVMAIKFRVINPFFAGLGIWILCDAVAFVAIHPSLINITISEDASSGEEALGIMSFFAKTFMRLIPIVFGTGVVLGTCALLFHAFGLEAGDFAPRMVRLRGAAGVPGAIVAAIGLPQSGQAILRAALLPLGSYVIFSFYCLMVDLLRSILSLKNK